MNCQVQISDDVEIKIAPGMVADIYTQPEKAKTNQHHQKIQMKKKVVYYLVFLVQKNNFI